MTILINYELFQDACHYYKTRFDFEQVEVPWLVSKESNLITKPEYAILGEILDDNHNRCLIASAEQGFIEEFLTSDRLQKNKRYMSLSPCFRLHDVSDELHQETFMKLELAYVTDNLQDCHREFLVMMNSAKDLFSQLIDNVYEISELDVSSEASKSITQYDLVTYKNDVEIELGSYGIRNLNNGEFLVYGTGLALPRLQHLISNSGYHLRNFVKEDYMSAYKIKEETQEFLDAVEQNDKLLQLCEMSDLIQAIEDYAISMGVDFDDLRKFGKKTSNAYQSKKRC